MDPIRAWLHMGLWQKFCFFFLFAITALALARAIRLAWWLRRCNDPVDPCEPGLAGRLRQYHKARRLARSTRGLTEAGLWLTCSGGAVGLYTAWTIIANTGRSTLALMAEGSLDTLEATAIGLCLCALLRGAALLFDVMVNAGSRRLQLTPDGRSATSLPAGRAAAVSRAIAAVRHGRRAAVAIASLLVAAALIELRPRYTRALGSGDELRVGYAIFDALHHLWAQLAIAFAAVGLLAWFGVLMESALSSRASTAPSSDGRPPPRGKCDRRAQES